MASLAAQAPLFSSLPPASFTNLTEKCMDSSISWPSLFGGEILEVSSSSVTNYTASFLPPMFFNSDPPLINPVKDLSFCNVTVTYTHPGQNDTINVNLWLPLAIAEDVEHDFYEGAGNTSPAWNGVLLSHGGGGFSTCLPDIFSHTALTQGYATSRTDGGHTPISVDPRAETDSWALLSPGNVNLYLLQDFASVALNDMSIISKQIVHSFYNTPPKHSYFQGCSTGGRQGLMLAQRYPTAYDGILSAAPAIYFPELLVRSWYGQMLMHTLNIYSKPCELDALTAAAVQACDELDGVKDGIVSNESACDFDPFPSSNPILRKPIKCKIHYIDEEHETTELVNISTGAAQLANIIWGREKSNTSLSHLHLNLPHPKTTYSTPSTGLLGQLGTKCFRENNTCVANPNPFAIDWLRLFLYKEPTLSVSDLLEKVTPEEFSRLMHRSSQEYDFLIGTYDPDLSDFRDAGGKLLLWHGMSDDAIPQAQSREYYESVVSFFASRSESLRGDEAPVNVEDFFRLFMVPGIQHCGGGEGVLPINAFDALRKWVEKGIAPAELDGESFNRADGEKLHRRLCRYPLVARYKGPGHDFRKADSFECKESF